MFAWETARFPIAKAVMLEYDKKGFNHAFRWTCAEVSGRASVSSGKRLCEILYQILTNLCVMLNFQHRALLRAPYTFPTCLCSRNPSVPCHTPASYSLRSIVFRSLQGRSRGRALSRIVRVGDWASDAPTLCANLRYRIEALLSELPPSSISCAYSLQTLTHILNILVFEHKHVCGNGARLGARAAIDWMVGVPHCREKAWVSDGEFLVRE